MKNFANSVGFVTLTRTQQRSIFGGGCGPTVECDGDGNPIGGGGNKCDTRLVCVVLSDCGDGGCSKCEDHPNQEYKICKA